MAKLKTGDKAPGFTLTDANGKSVSLSDFKDKTVVLYFYPKDDTPGCAKEACSFRDELPKIKTKNAAVLGVSMDSDESHKKFEGKYGLNFTLLADTKGDVCKAYDVYGLRSLYGRKFFGIRRTTFIIDSGRIAHIFENVHPEGHGKEVLETLKALEKAKKAAA